MAQSKLIEEYALKDTTYMTAGQKAGVLKDWEKFLKNGCKLEDFSDRLYCHLHLNCEFIAHYNREAFYTVYFKRPEMTVKFVDQFDPNGNGLSIEYKLTHWLNGDNADINEAMRKIMGKYAKHLRENALNWDKELDLREIERLMKKHNLSSYSIVH